MMRLRPPIGIDEVRIAFAIVAGLWFMSLCAPADAQTVLPIAENGEWTTTLVASSKDGETIRISDSFGVFRTIAPNGTLVVPKLGGFVSNLTAGFGVLAYAGDGRAVLNYREQTEFSVPPLSPLVDGQEIPRIINQGVTRAYIAILAPSDAALTLEVFDSENRNIGREFIGAKAGATLYPLEANLDGGRVEIRQGYTGFGQAPPRTTVYVFAAIGPASGQTQRIEVAR